MKNKKTVVENKFKTYIIASAAIFVFFVSIFLMISALNIKTVSDVTLFTYNEKSNLDYKVYLKENNYFKEEYLEKNNQYIASLIDYIDIDFDYNLSSSKPIDVNYTYKIVASISAQYKVDTNSTKEVWENEYVLVEPKVLNVKDKSNINIKENVKLNYDEYNQIINNFKKDYMLAVTSDLTVKMLVELDGKYVPAEKVFNLKNDLSLEIPLSEQTLDIKMNYKDFNNQNVVTAKKIGIFKNLALLVIGIAMFVLSSLTIYKQVRKIIKSEKQQNQYIKELKKLLHDYGDIIVEVKKAPVFSKTKAYEVQNFNELVDAHLETKSPIVFTETKKNKEGMFVLHNNDLTYYYMFKNKENKK